MKYLGCVLVVALACSSQRSSPQPEPAAAALATRWPSATQVATPEPEPDPAVLERKYAPPFAAKLGYDPTRAQHLPLIQRSRLKLKAAELERLRQQGFAIAAERRFPSFAYGYASIYAEDLPLFISADSILDALHRSYDKLLLACERDVVSPELARLLASLRSKLRAEPESETRRDLDVYLAVAEGLLLEHPQDLPPSAAEMVARALAAHGMATIEMFGAARLEDMSQFAPRGHYERNPYARYFRTMIWLGRIDLRMIDTEHGTLQLQRRQIAAALLLESLFDAEDRQRLERMDSILHMFIGESDNWTLQDLPRLREALGITELAQLGAVPDATLIRVILEHGADREQVASTLRDGKSAALPPSQRVVLFGQRYTIDSHVFSRVTWPRTRAKRMLPDPLDAAFSVLANDQAYGLLREQREAQQYAGELVAFRNLVDARPAGFWHGTLYNEWLYALRELSPRHERLADPRAHGLPRIAATEAWGRRILGTQLASWAQLRHDTILYAKQSYSGMASCEFPDAAVDPYPEFYAAIGRYAEHGLALAGLIEASGASTDLAQAIAAHFKKLGEIGRQLQDIALAQQNHTPVSAAQLDFVNDAVVVQRESRGCVSVERASGWYAQLFFDANPLEFDPTIADVHTQPTDPWGTVVGKVLHVGTAAPRLMVVTLDGCQGGPRAYVGLASAYHERVTQNFQRLTDSEWTGELSKGPVEPPWSAARLD